MHSAHILLDHISLRETPNKVSGESHTLLDLCDCQRRVQTLGAGPTAIENGMAPVQAHAVVQGILAFSGPLVSRVCYPAV